MPEDSRVEMVTLAAIVGTAWVGFEVIGYSVGLPMAMVAPRVSPPLFLAVWYLLPGIGIGLAAAFIIRPIQGGEAATLVGVLVGIFAMVNFRFTGTATGAMGELAIRTGCAGVSAGFFFSFASRRLNRVAR